MTKDVWMNANKDNAGDLILTGYQGDFKDMPIYEEVISLAGSGFMALDFGCGVGRNTIVLSKSFESVIGFDLPSMLALIPEENKNKSTTYTYDWGYVKTLYFDVVLASLVFQHIENNELEDYLKDLNEISNNMILHSRTWIDHSELEVLPIVEKYFVVDKINYTRDPNNPSDDHFIAYLHKRIINE
jgi:cyclopropane fatty-acyl-phospholipid synthase-like methyltransferase